MRTPVAFALLLLGCAGLTTDVAESEADAAAPPDADPAPAPPPQLLTDHASAPAQRYDGPQVDLYLSAGNHVVDGSGETTGSCNNESSLTCAIYKLTWDLDAQRATTVQKIVDEPDHAPIYPVISPSGHYLAHTGPEIVRGRVRKSKNHVVYVRDLTKWRGNEHPVVHVIDDAKWPGWLDEDTLLVTRFTDKHWGDVLTVGRDAGTPLRVLGPGTTYNGPSFSQARPNPTNPQLVSSHGDNTFKGPHGATVPHVNDLKTGKQYDFDLDRDGDGSPDLVGCAHTAWTPDGNGVICTEQFTDDYPYPGGPDYNHVYRFEKKGDGYVIAQADEKHKGYLFRPKDPEELRSFHPGFYTKDHPSPAGGGYCQGIVYYKNAVYCGNDLTVALTLWCIDNVNYAAKRKVMNSRAVLVDFEDWDNPKHYDITGALESANLLTNANSNFVTCH